MGTTMIKYPKRMKQLIDFQGLIIDEDIHPTDIDGIIEYKDHHYILFEMKHRGAEVPFGQRLALRRMVDDFKKVGKDAIAFICEHTVDDTNKAVIAAECIIREIYYSGEKQWRAPALNLSVMDAVNMFQTKEKYR